MLLVCKAWLRVATPLLYKEVVLRSKAQAGALVAALRGKHDPGRFIKKLRLEGGFGAHMNYILKCSPNVTDLFISTAIHSPDTTSGLVLGLPLLNPTRLILFEKTVNRLPMNKWVLQLFQALADVMDQKWSNLNTIVLTHNNFDSAGEARRNFQKALVMSKTIQIISLQKFPRISFMNKLAEDPSLCTLEIRSTPEDMGTRYMDRLTAERRITPLLKFTDADTRIRTPISVTELNVILPTDPDFRPMASATAAVSDSVWDRILHIAMISNEIPLPRNPNDFSRALRNELHDMKINSRRLNFVLVSKTFCRLALPYLYRYPTFWDDASLQRFSNSLCFNPAPGVHVREIRTSDFTFKSSFSQPTPNFVPIFSCTSGLTKLVGGVRPISLKWDAFETLAQTAGQTLVEMVQCFISVRDHLVPREPTIFLDFTALRSLRWSSPATFVHAAPGLVSAALPSLESLHVESPGIFSALQQFDLPMLRRLVLDDSIEASAWDSFMIPCLLFFARCSALMSLDLRLIGQYEEEIYPPRLGCPFKHHALVELSVRKDPGANKRIDHEEWSSFWGGSAWDDFPSLRKITAAPLEWPTNEHAISKSPWVKWSADLLVHNIRLVDKQGTHWRPRFQGSRR
ncbi:F-box domain-containing protein [Mycena sanguinolenta]|uniref:F-box domain-containing protein n=1 Tax=Mycena sanguinolenta TaxID=230812 RepID=A0A8H6XD18_9AGAR|nr:F-box domain-containing protein [Mycena sanguinolenta]